MTDGFDVLVQLVIAAITTEPCRTCAAPFGFGEASGALSWDAAVGVGNGDLAGVFLFWSAQECFSGPSRTTLSLD